MDATDLTPEATAERELREETGYEGAHPQLIGRISDNSDLQIGLQAAVAVMVMGSLLMLLVIHFVRRDGLHSSRLPAFRSEPDPTVHTPT